MEDSINSGERKKVRFERHSKWPDWHTMKCVLFLDPLLHALNAQKVGKSSHAKTS